LKRWSRLDGFIVIIFAALVILFYWRLLTPDLNDRQSFIPGDFSAQFWAFTTFEVRELSAGRLPLWNPYTFAGAPFWADVQSAVFYPPSLLTILLSAPAGFSLFALEIEAIAHVWLAAIFMYFFMRQATHSQAAAVIAGLTFAFSGYLTGYPTQQLAVLEADVWLPLILLFIHLAHEQRHIPSLENEASENEASNPKPRVSIRYLVLAGAAWGLALLAGHPQSALIIAYLSSAYFFFLWLSPPTSHPKSKIQNPLLYWLLFITTGLALAAIQFLPAVEYTLLSVRAEGTYNEMSSGFPLTDGIQVLLPGQVSFYSPLYIGIVGLILALWATLARPARQRGALFWAITAFITLIISFGGNTFFYSPLYLFTPGFAIFRGQERWAFATAFSLSVLAGYGFNQLLMTRNSLSTTTHRLSRLTLYVFLFALLLTFLFFFGLNDTGWTPASPFYGLLGAATLLIVLSMLAWLLWQAAPRLSPAGLTGLTAALICFDLFTANWQTNLYPQLPEWHTRVPAAVEAIKQDAAASPAEPFRVYNEFRLYGNYGVPLELEDLWGASPLRPDRYDKFLAPPMPIERTWELLNVKYVITWREELYLPSTIIHQEPADDGTTYVHRLNQVGPRAWLVTEAEIVADATILADIADPNFERWRIALLEPEAAPMIDHLDPSQTQQIAGLTAHISRFTPYPARLSYDVTSPSPALLILSEPHYPGWRATIDGQSVPIVRADYVLRAVPVPAGEHRVELTFRPLSFRLGAVISSLAVLVIGAVLIYRRRGRSGVGWTA
jgi:hypothetical protein